MMWNNPWKYREGIAISTGLLIAGVLLQIAIGPLDWMVFKWPVNIIVLAAFIALLATFYRLRNQIILFRFMTQVEAAVPALATASVLTITMGLTRQVSEEQSPTDAIGISKMLSFWPFILIYLWNIIVVAEVFIYQMMHFQKRYIPSMVSHLGLFIFVTCGTLGSADMQRLKMYCEEGRPEWRAIDNERLVHDVPIGVELRKFSIDEYPPKMAIFDSKTGNALPIAKSQNIIIEDDFSQGNLLGWTITKEKYLEDAMPNKHTSGFVAYKDKGAATAILIKAQKGKVAKRGWISTGSYLFAMSTLKLDENTELAMMPREPLRYVSDVNIYTKDGKKERAYIEVNKPYSIGSWKIYQYDYNKEMGKWSYISVFELVSDPWLPATYCGLFLLLAGAILMFITAGRKRNTINK